MDYSLFVAAWWLLPLNYTASGVHKSFAPSWRKRSALHHVLELRTARDSFLRAMLLSAPPILLELMTSGSLTL
jgi:hypothetical protein